MFHSTTICYPTPNCLISSILIKESYQLLLDAFGQKILTIIMLNLPGHFLPVKSIQLLSKLITNNRRMFGIFSLSLQMILNLNVYYAEKGHIL